MSRFYAYTRFRNPGLHIWREGTSTKSYLRPSSSAAGPGWVEFDYGLEPGILNDVCFMLFNFNEADHPGSWEKDAHQRKVPRSPMFLPVFQRRKIPTQKATSATLTSPGNPIRTTTSNISASNALSTALLSFPSAYKFRASTATRTFLVKSARRQDTE